MKEIVLFALAFSIVNATLEEMLWRGTLLPVLAGQVSWLYALVVTSLAFGLHHIALGIPFWPALGFSIGGFFFAIVKWRSESLFPPILWHFIINLLMVFSGFILPY
ncbi:CPBP family intramembrane glutamic endopeptidase [Rossellomorea marisflavi]